MIEGVNWVQQSVLNECPKAKLYAYQTPRILLPV